VYVSRNAIAVDQLSGLIQQVFNALATVEQAATTPKAEPAVTDHKLTPEQHRALWGLPFSYPLVAPNYAETRSALAKKVWVGSQGVCRTKESGAATYSQDGGASLPAQGRSRSPLTK
jgi:predicted transcriptional regulator